MMERIGYESEKTENDRNNNDTMYQPGDFMPQIGVPDAVIEGRKDEENIPEVPGDNQKKLPGEIRGKKFQRIGHTTKTRTTDDAHNQ